MKEDAGNWRHELKYVCSVATLRILEERIQPLLASDPHVGKDGTYQIRSLYFDDETNSCYRENEDGTDPREKFRIRIYDAKTDRIHLELKRKRSGMTQKLSCPLTRSECSNILAGRTLLWEPGRPALLQKFWLQQRQRRLLPKVVVAYKRRPWVLATGNVRITFDENITSSRRVGAFLDPVINGRPVMPVGWHILEVKYDDFLPDFIRQVLQLEYLRRTSFSKYYLCRRLTG